MDFGEQSCTLHSSSLLPERDEASGENATCCIVRMNPSSVCVFREEAHEHMGRAAQQSQRATELEGLLDVVKTRVQDLEDRCLGKAAQQLSHAQQLQQEQQEAQVCQQTAATSLHQ